MSCKCGRPGARTGRQRAVGLDRPGARPLMAPTGCFPNSLPDVALVDVNLSTLGEVEVSWPSVAVVADEFHRLPSAVPISAAVEYVFSSNVPQDDVSFEDLFQFSHVTDRGAGFVDSLFPLLDLMSPCGCNTLASRSALEVLHNSLSHTVEVTIS